MIRLKEFKEEIEKIEDTIDKIVSEIEEDQ